ncbi:hypothetical protein Tco_0015806 [Tanacetum coccineum]
MQSWGRSSFARVMIELRADVELKEKIVVVMPKITKEGHYTCNVRVEYEWKPRAGEKKTVMKPSQASRGVPVSPKIDFKPQKEYRPVTKKPNTSSSVDNDVEFDTNGGTSNLGNNEATPSESSFMNIDNDGEFASNTLIDRSDKGYGTNNLLEQLRDSYPNNDDYDPYDDDMYENHDLSEHLQSICDDLDITVRGRKKK